MSSVLLFHVDLPTALEVSLNGSKIIINPNVDNYDNMKYQLSGGFLMTLTQPIIVSPPETISFILCQENSTFFIGMMYNNGLFI